MKKLKYGTALELQTKNYKSVSYYCFKEKGEDNVTVLSNNKIKDISNSEGIEIIDNIKPLNIMKEVVLSSMSSRLIIVVGLDRMFESTYDRKKVTTYLEDYAKVADIKIIIFR